MIKLSKYEILGICAGGIAIGGIAGYWYYHYRKRINEFYEFPARDYSDIVINEDELTSYVGEEDTFLFKKVSGEEFDKLDYVRNTYYPESLDDSGTDIVNKRGSVDSEKPGLFDIKLSETDGSHQEIIENASVVLTAEEYRDVPEQYKHVATYFIDDDILAGPDDSLEEVDRDEIFGGVTEDAFETMNNSGSGVYVMCGDGLNALEIVVSDSNYLEEFNKAYTEAYIEGLGYASDLEV